MSDTESILDDSDLEFYTIQNQSILNQFKETKLEEVSKKKKRKLNKDEEEQDYEKRPRKKLEDEEANERNLLPIRTLTGWQERKLKVEVKPEKEEMKEKKQTIKEKNTKPIKKEKEEKEEEDYSEFEDLEIIDEQPKEEIEEVKELSLQDQLVQIAQLSADITASPDENIQKLKQLRLITENSKDPKVIKVSLLSQLAVYKDLIPGYPIRPLSDKEKQQPLTKEVKKLRQFEECLLNNYQKYLSHLEVLTNQNHPKNSDSDLSLLHICLKCACELLKSVPHFNERPKLFHIVVRYMNLAMPKVEPFQPDTLQLLCSDALVQMFKQDLVGEYTLEAVKQISQLIKQKKFHVKPVYLKVLLSIPLQSDMKTHEKEIENLRQPLDKKQIKKQKVTKKQIKQKQLEKRVKLEMKETEAEVDSDIRKRKHSEILAHIFVIYFRILKNCSDQSAGVEHLNSIQLLSQTLVGIEQFGNLISLDYFHQILKELKLILSNEALELNLKFHCLSTCFSLAYGPLGENLSLDLREHVKLAFQSICELAKDISTYSDHQQKDAIDILLHLLNLLFFKCDKKTHSPSRMVAFLQTTSLLLPLLTFTKPLLALLDFYSRVFIRFPKLYQNLWIIDSEELDSFPFGLADPDIWYTGQSVPKCILWALKLMKRHSNEKVREKLKEIDMIRKQKRYSK